MYLTRKWKEIMGPKEERLETEENKATKVAAHILLVGSVITLYYAIMLNQVASTTDNPIFTPLGAKLIPVDIPLMLTILVAGVASTALQIRSGAFSSYKRLADIDYIPWDYISAFALACGAILGILTCSMRIVAEIQIVGFNNVAWLGDLAIGAVFFMIGFAVGFVAVALSIQSAIKRRKQIESELGE
ncbi:hypothetical protein AALA21_06540 [Eggerthellaceae bacterium 3-80]|nr:hypothetical protein D7W09_05430 [bacterium D16-34]